MRRPSSQSEAFHIMDFKGADDERQIPFNTTAFSSSYDFSLPMASSFPSPHPKRLTLTPSPSPIVSSSDSEFEFKADIVNESPADLPKPLKSLHETPMPPFLSKTYDLVDDPLLDEVISWGETGNTFVVWKPLEFARLILPRNFKHGNFSSFVRQLNTYGFHKIGTDKWEFANEGFVKGQRHLLRRIQRRRLHQSQQTGSVDDTRKSGIEGKIEGLRKERSLMMQELAQLQHDQCGAAQLVESMMEKLETAEKRQKQMVSFLAKMLQKPAFLSCLKQARKQKSIGSAGSARKCVKLQPDELGDSPSLLFQPLPCSLTTTSQVEGTTHEERAEIDQPLCLNERPASFPRDLVTSLPEYWMAGTESMGMIDVWDMGCEAYTDVPATWDTLRNSDVLGFGNGDVELPDIWGIDSLQSAGSLGFETRQDYN